MRKWWLGIPLIALGAVAVAVAVYVGTGRLWPFGSADQGARSPEATRPAQEPLLFRAARDGERIVLSGTVSREETRGALLEETRQAVSNAIVTDEIKTSAKAPPGLDDAAIFSLRQLARLPAGTVSIRHDTIAIAGQASDVEAYNALAAAPSLPDGFRLDIAGLIPPAVRPYTWSATSSDAAITVAGHVPSQTAREAVAAAAREAFPDKPLVLQLQPASGVPPEIDFDTAVRFALAQLAQLRVGTAEMADTTVSLRGDVTDRDTFASVQAAMQTGLPPGLKAGSVAITLSKPSPYTFGARREAGTLTLTGYYPDPEARTAIHQLIRGRFFSEQVVDRLRAADGAPQNYLAGVSFGLEHLARLASGEVAVSGPSLRLGGEALYEQSAEQTVRAVQAMPVRGWSGRAEIKVRSSDQAEAARLRSAQP